MTGFQAAILIAGLERLPQQIAVRTERARLLKRELPEITWQRQPAAITQNSYYLLVGRVPGNPRLRDELCRRWSEANVPCTPFYPHTLYENELYRTADCRVMPCPVAEACIRDAFWLPHRVLLADERVVKEIAQAISVALV